MELKGIKNIIFDLGGVIINLDLDLTKQRFKILFKDKYDEMEKDLHTKNVLNEFETGKVTVDEFISFFQNYNIILSSEEIREAWNAMLLDIPKERLDLVSVLSKKYNVFLLSNTNEIHLNYINNYVSNSFQQEGMSALFKKAYYSHKMGLRKPDTSIFTTVLKDAALQVEETLFIDDSEEHIVAAKQLNLKTRHLLSSETIIDIFNED